MAKKPTPRRKAMMLRAVEAVRDNPLKSAAAILAFLAGLDGAIAQADRLLWVVPAPIPYVDKHIRMAGDPILLDLANGKREASQRAIDDLELKEIQAKTPEEKLKIQQIKRRETQTYDALTDQIKTIKQRNEGQ